MEIDKLIISLVLRKNEYRDRVLPYLKDEYFQDKDDRTLFNSVNEHLEKYHTTPDKLQLKMTCQEKQWIDDDLLESTLDTVWKEELPDDLSWCIEKTEEFCKNQAVYNAIMKSIAIYDGTDKNKTTMAIPDIIKEAVSVNFDSTIGLDMFDDAEKRFEYYTHPEFKVPFMLSSLNDITNGGLPTKTLSLIMAGTNAGKSMLMISLASDYIKQGTDVLYITMEMREEEIFRRVDAHLLDVDINKVASIEHDDFINKIEKLKRKSYGRLKVKEYPPGAAHPGHFKTLINELQTKKNFKPKVVFVDYLGIIASSRIKVGTQNSYFYLKAAAEELRAFATEEDVVVISAMQIVRSALSSSDFNLEDISEGASTAHTADMVLGLIRTDELDQCGQALLKQLKNRFGNKAVKSRILMGVDLEKQRVYDISNQQEQDNLIIPEDVMRSSSGSSLKDKFKILNG